MDVPQLSTASAYINNLLLARGLLRSGKPLDFASLGAINSRDHKTSIVEHDGQPITKHGITAAEIINLVHDLILRRDRDSDELTSLAETLADVRTTSATQSSKLEHLRSQNKELQRQIDLSHSSLRAAQAALRSSESAFKTQKENLNKVKNVMTQVKTQCANDIRKRDVQIQKLKNQLSASQRGSNGRPVPPSCIVTHPLGSTIVSNSIDVLPSGNGMVKPGPETLPSVEDAQYSLKQETTEFLTQLSQSLSDENDSLLVLIRNTLGTLRQLQNLPPNSPQRPSLHHDSNEETADKDLLQFVPATIDTLSSDLEFVLANLRDILTDASFVSIDEVFAREEEINRLREGWDKMESRWREVIEMLKNWQDRLLHGGATVNLEELRLGLNIGESLRNMRTIQSTPDSSIHNDQDASLPDLGEDESPVLDKRTAILSLRHEASQEKESYKYGTITHLRSESGSPTMPLQEGSPNINTSLARDGSNCQQLKAPRRRTSSKHSLDPYLTFQEDQENHPTLTDVPTTSLEASQERSILTRAYHDTAKHPPSLRKGLPIRDHSDTAERRISEILCQASTSSSSRAEITVESPAIEHQPILDCMADSGKDEGPMTIEQKLKFAESEARRVSGTSASPSVQVTNKPSPEPLFSEHLQTQASKTSHEQPDEGFPRQDAYLKVQNAKSGEDAEHGSVETAETPEESTARKETASYAKKTRSTQNKETMSKSSRTITTRVPTKAPASVGNGDKRTRARTKAKDTVKEMKEASESGRDLDITDKRSRRKRKSTLSPQELEELMGIRQSPERSPYNETAKAA